jgi:type IV secretory pathway VirB10-like protein
MNIWFKIAIVIAVVVVLIVLVGKFLPSGPKSPPQPEKTFYDVAKEDDKRLRAEPNIKDVTASKPPVASGVERPAPVQPAQRNETQPVAEAKLKFKELSEDEQVGAEELFEMAITSRKMGRLPMITYGQMVNYCRQIIQRFPGSEFDFKARRMLADIPEQYRSQYKITAEEIDLSKWPRQ